MFEFKTAAVAKTATGFFVAFHIEGEILVGCEMPAGVHRISWDTPHGVMYSKLNVCPFGATPESADAPTSEDVYHFMRML